MTRTDDELGPEKLCSVCGEWWPLDEEFWYFTDKAAGEVYRSRGQTYTRSRAARYAYGRCRACWSEKCRRDAARRVAA